MFDSKAIDKIRDHLIEKNQSLSVAESVTSGFLQAAMATAEKALQFFQGGITTYNIDQKVRHLHIDRAKGEACNCVSEDTANEMSRGVCRLFDTDWGIAITGYATAVPESGFSLFAFFSICFRGEILSVEKIELSRTEEPENAQVKYVNTIIRKFSEILSRALANS